MNGWRQRASVPAPGGAIGSDGWLSGREKPAPNRLGNELYAPIMPAPGEYVLEA